MLNDVIDSLQKVVSASNPHLKGRLISALDVDNESQTFKIMKRVKAVMYYYNPETKKKTPCLTVQEVMRIPSNERDAVMREFSKRFLTAAFMWTASQNYKDLIDGKFDRERDSDSDRGSGSGEQA